MKKLLFIFFLLISTVTFAQVKVIKVQGIPGAYNFSKSGDSLIFYVAGVRHALSVGSTVDLSNYYNKTQVDNSLNGKLAISDTAAMLSPYATELGKKRDTSYKQSITAIKPLHWNVITPDSATIGLYVDTTSSLSDGSDTTVPTTKAVKNLISTVTAEGITRTELIDTANNKVNISDTAAILSPYLRKNTVSGGTINQVLKKNSSTDYDWSWQDESGGSTIDTSGAFLIDVDSVAPNTQRFYKGSSYKDFVFTGVDTSHLSDRINLKFNTTDTTGKWFSWGYKRNDSVFLCKNTTCTFIFKDSSGGGGGGSSNLDTSFLRIRANGLYSAFKQNKGIVIENTTVDGTTQQNSPPLIFRGGQNGAPYWYRIQAEAQQITIAYSTDSINYSPKFILNRIGEISGVSNANASGYFNAPQFSGTKMNLLSSIGYGVFGANRQPNPLAQLELVDSTRGFLKNKVSTTRKLTMTSNVYAGTLLSGGTGNTNIVGSTRTFTSTSGATGSTVVTISGGVLTAVLTPFGTGSGFKVGDTLSCTNCGGTGSQYLVTKLTGDTAKGIELIDTSISAPQHYVGNIDGYGDAWQNGFIVSSASALHVTFGNDYIFTGTTATYTLPTIYSNVLGRANAIRIINNGSGSITVNTNTGNVLIPKSSTTATNTITIVSGASAEIMPIGTYFKVLYNN